MKKLSTINEDLLGGIQKKVMASEERKEDQGNNIKYLKGVDMGGGVLWADQDLMIDWECLITHQTAMHYVLETGWRLPHVEDVEELAKSGVDILYDKTSFHVRNSSGELIFPKRGFIYSMIGDKLIDENLYYGWTYDTYSSQAAHIFVLEDNKEILYSDIKGSAIDQNIQRKSDKLCVRLVKDK